MFKQIRNGFFAGLVLLAPLGVTVFVIHLLVTKVGAPVGALMYQYIFETIPTEGSIKWYALNILSTLLVFIIITVTGFLSRYFIGKIFITLSEKLIDALPFVNAVYKTVKQIVDTFSKQQKAVFQKVVLTEYPRKGVYVLGFLTSEARGEVQERTGAEVINIFVPTTPNPTSGFLLMVPKDEIIEMDMSVGEGMKLIVSGGAVTPPWPHPAGMHTTARIKNPKAIKAPDSLPGPDSAPP